MIGRKRNGLIGALAPMRRVRSLLNRARHDSLVRNSSYLMASTMVSSAFGYLFWTVAARLYTLSAVGGAAALVSAMSLAALIGGIGSNLAIIGALPGRLKPLDWSSVITASLIATGIASTAAGVVTAVVLAIAGRNPQLYNNVFIMSTLIMGVVLTTTSLLLESVWIAERQSGWLLVYTGIFSAGKLLMLPVLLAGGALGIFGAWLVILALTVAAVVITLARLYGFRLRWVNMRAEIVALKGSLTGNYFVTLGDMAPVYLIPIVVSIRLSAADTAYFYAAWKIGSFFPAFASSVGSSLFAEGSHVSSKALAMASTGMRIALPFIAAGTLVAIIGGRIGLGFFGAGYADHAYVLLVLLAVSAFPDAIVNIYRSVLRVQQRYGMASLIAWGITTTRVLLTWLWLPTYGIAGAGWAWLVTQVLGAVLVTVDLAIHKDTSVIATEFAQEQYMSDIAAKGPE